MRKNNNRSGLLAVISFVCFAVGACLAAEEAQPQYLNVGPDTEKALIFQFSGASLRVAKSVGKLANAKEIECRKTTAAGGNVIVKAAKVPFTLPGSEKGEVLNYSAEMTLITNPRQSRFYGYIYLTLADKDGVPWVYERSVKNSPSTDAAKAPLIKTFTPEDVKLEIDCRADKKDKQKIGIGLRLTGAEILRDGKMAVARVEVIDSTGKTVSKVEKPLNLLGYG